MIIFMIVLTSGYFGATTAIQSLEKESAWVIEVIDGDTIRVKDEKGLIQNIRLLGVDTPETNHPTKSIECYGKEASDFTKRILFGKKVQLEYDIEKFDKYKRTLAYVYLEQESFNEMLVEQGYAKILNIEPNDKYANRLMKLQIKARNQKVGLWGSCV